MATNINRLRHKPRPQPASALAQPAPASVQPQLVTRPAPISSGHGHIHPLVAGGFGAIFLGLGLVGASLQVGTNEAFLNGRQIADYAPHWEVYNQIPSLFTGGLGAQQGPDFASWVIMFVYVASGVVGMALEETLNATARFIARLLRVAITIIVLFDCYTSMNNGPTLLGGGLLGHVTFLACVLLCSLVFAALGLRLIFHYCLRAFF